MLSGIYVEEMQQFTFEMNMLRDFLSKCLEVNFDFITTKF